MRIGFSWIFAVAVTLPTATAAADVASPAAALASKPALNLSTSGALHPSAISQHHAVAAHLAVPYLTGLMRGHLNAALALAESGHNDAAVIYASHPVEENLAELTPLLSAEAASALRLRISTLKELLALKATHAEILAAHQMAAVRLQAIDDGAAAASGMTDHQMLALVVAWLTEAADEYEDAWSGLELRNAVEYQDGFGFFRHAKAKLDALLPRLRLADPAAASEIASAASRIGMAWPAVIPPGKPAMATSTLRAVVAVIEINARRLGA